MVHVWGGKIRKISQKQRRTYFCIQHKDKINSDMLYYGQMHPLTAPLRSCTGHIGIVPYSYKLFARQIIAGHMFAN